MSDAQTWGKPREQTESSAETARQWFPGNPFPNGHALERLEWSLRIEPDDQLWCDLHAETRPYVDEYPESLADETETDSAWTSPSVWLNYHGTFLSSSHLASISDAAVRVLRKLSPDAVNFGVKLSD